jgi:hypothetical protein
MRAMSAVTEIAQLTELERPPWAQGRGETARRRAVPRITLGRTEERATAARIASPTGRP